MAALALAGIAGMYLRQVRRIGVLGLVGYLLFSLGYLAMLCERVRSAWSSSPTIAQSSAEYVDGVVAVATNSSSTRGPRLVRAAQRSSASATSLGGLVFGIALFRAGVLARWAAALLAVAAVATMAPSLLPMVNQRLFAVPNGIALIGLGWSLWRDAAFRVDRSRHQHDRRTARPGRRPMTTHTAAGPTRSARPTGWVPFALVALVVIPALAGSLRLVELAGGPLLLPANPRMTASPLPVVVHIACAVPYAVLGAFQFSAAAAPTAPALAPVHRAGRRGPRPGGRALRPVDDAVLRPPAGTGELAFLFRLTFGSALAACILLGLSAIRHGDVATHQAWMTRGVRHRPRRRHPDLHPGLGPAVFGPGVFVKDLSLGAAWVVNLAVAEVRHPPLARPPGRRPPCSRLARDDPGTATVARRLRAADRRPPRPALVGLVRRAHPDPRRRRHHHPHRRRGRPGRAARHTQQIRDLGVTLISVAPIAQNEAP